MFRDPPYFRALREQVVPILQTYPSIKVWVAGCSTRRGTVVARDPVRGREDCRAHRALRDRHQRRCAAPAENGIYALERMAGFTSELSGGGRQAVAVGLLSRGVRRGAGSRRSLKSRVVFADHSLATDSVFLEAHLVSCRNVLIYFDRALQDRALGLFSDSLVRRGFLGLGSKESLRFSKHADSFDGVQRRASVSTRRCSDMQFTHPNLDSPDADPAAVDAVVIGASAGGIDALNRCCPGCPKASGPPCWSSCTAAGHAEPAAWTSFAHAARLPVVEPNDKDEIAPGRVLSGAARLSHDGRSGPHRSRCRSIRRCAFRGHRWTCCSNRRRTCTASAARRSCCRARTTTARTARAGARAGRHRVGASAGHRRSRPKCRVPRSNAARPTPFTIPQPWPGGSLHCRPISDPMP